VLPASRRQIHLVFNLTCCASMAKIGKQLDHIIGVRDK
jgi:hypothetical protein